MQETVVLFVTLLALGGLCEIAENMFLRRMIRTYERALDRLADDCARLREATRQSSGR